MATTKSSKKGQAAAASNEAAEELQKSIADAPFFYTDSLLSLTVGPYVSKATFGQQVQGATNPPTFKATVTVVLPTNAMLDMANHIVKAFARSGIAEQLAGNHDQLKQALEHLAPPAP